MIKISASDVEEALLKASKELNCSCIDLEYEVVQEPSNGFFGCFGKKDAIIVASIKERQKITPQPIETKKYKIEDAIKEIKEEINELFSHLPFKLNEINVEKYDSNTISIYFKGEDSALLIGEKGYRYKAISYLLFNWINPKYGFNIRLEIERFLANQEEMIGTYLEPIIKEIKKTNKTFSTKPFDGVLVYIALKILRENLPDRFIMIKTNEHNETYIVVTSNNADNK